MSDRGSSSSLDDSSRIRNGTPSPSSKGEEQTAMELSLSTSSSNSTFIAGNTPVKGPNNNNNARQKRTSLACIRCRARHIRCPGGDPCKKCQLAKAKCEYVEADKKIVVSMKYLSKLHDDIARLKKDNASLRNNLKESEGKRASAEIKKEDISPLPRPNFPPPQQSFSAPDNVPLQAPDGEVIHPTLDKYGRLIQSRTGEKLYVGSSSMTLFGLEIQNMVPSFTSSALLPSSSLTSPIPSPGGQDPLSPMPMSENSSTSQHSKRETKILEKEGNAYKITLSKTNTRPGLSINFSLPSYSYSMLLVDTFINYNDGCFYFFNEGLIKRFLMNLYSGKARDNKHILRRNIPLSKGPEEDENSIKRDTDDETILETIWFCKILLIFAIGEMYLGTESDTHTRRLKMENKGKNKAKREKHTLPGSGFFYQASELFTGLFASGAIDNITKDGGIEVMLLYAFYLQVADCTIASYFYFGLALRAALILGWHVDADKENLNRFELEHRRRIWWTVYMYERMLSSKAGLPLSFADDSVSTELPIDFKVDLTDFPRDETDVRGYYIFPPADYINNCVTITQINAVILSSLYTKQPTVNILPVVSDLVQRLMTWKNTLPKYLLIDFTVENPKVSRLIVNLMTEYFQGINLAVRPLLFHFATKKLKELQVQNTQNRYIDLTKYSKNVLTLLNASFQASINTIKSIWSLLPDNMVALFGWMDREYLFTSASTLILFNASFGVHEATKTHIDHALVIFTKMKRLGNYPAALRRAQLLKLIRVLDFNGVMNDILEKHDDEEARELFSSSESLDKNVFNDLSEEANEVLGELQAPSLKTSELDFLQYSNTAGQQSNIQHAPQQQGPIQVGPQRQNVPNMNQMQNIIPDPNAAGDVYTNQDLAGIEGLTYLDEEQKLWNEITNDAGWLNVAGGNPNQPPGIQFSNPALKRGGAQQVGIHVHQEAESPGFSYNVVTPQDFPQAGGFSLGSGGYSDLINHEFQDFMDET
ncbi:PUT3 [[Candida] subhashii]|uniref:PUT3 n=1 Tax=[Candida] subhashii TaxID=561895 RepID=A0A8J5QKY1_9ASCO|nr:PUT3 [[Candida] subhashii]KAG7662355.1 PUT3 [[Candida] subhashii]